MKRYLLSFFLVAAVLGAFAQCTPNPIYQDSLFGVWPDTTTNFSPAGLDQSYYQQLDLIVPTNAGDINPSYNGVMLDSVQFTGITGLPPGLSVSCASQTPASCTFLAGVLGCGVISGTPTQLGTYELTLNVIGYAQILGATVPIPYSFTGYRIIVVDGLGITSMAPPLVSGLKNVPNPFATRTFFEFNLARAAEVHVKVFNLLGEELWQQRVPAKAGPNKVPFESGNLQEGVYLYKIESGKQTFTGRMVLYR